MHVSKFLPIGLIDPLLKISILFCLGLINSLLFNKKNCLQLQVGRILPSIVARSKCKDPFLRSRIWYISKLPYK